MRLVLEGYARSNLRDFEVLVADDGSGPETAELVRRMAAHSPYALRHVRQPHEGFRLAAVRNLAARSALGEVFVLTDGDCIPLPGSLAAHADRCAPGRAVTGGRCLLTEEETAARLDGAAESALDSTQALARELPGLRRLVRKNRLYAVSRLKRRPKLLTANASVHRSDFERVNGFDERFVGWGYEDEDLARRLRRSGVRILDASLDSLVLHLFHPVHVSHRPDARAGSNYRYFRTEHYLTRPLRGLKARVPQELAIELLGDVPPGLSSVPRLPAGTKSEVSLHFGRRFIWRFPRDEVRFHHLDPGDFPGEIELYRFLAERL